MIGHRKYIFLLVSVVYSFLNVYSILLTKLLSMLWLLCKLNQYTTHAIDVRRSLFLSGASRWACDEVHACATIAVINRCLSLPLTGHCVLTMCISQSLTSLLTPSLPISIGGLERALFF